VGVSEVEHQEGARSDEGLGLAGRVEENLYISWGNLEDWESIVQGTCMYAKVSA
jgi:hypothetical protein